jgi:hypothetical protein
MLASQLAPPPERRIYPAAARAAHRGGGYHSITKGFHGIG